MLNKRPILALLPLALLAACNEPSDGNGRAASGEVLEGTISDAMLPVDRVRSEPPLEDPEAFAEAREEADEAAASQPSPAGADAGEPAEGEAEEAPAEEPAPEPED